MEFDNWYDELVYRDAFKPEVPDSDEDGFYCPECGCFLGEDMEMVDYCPDCGTTIEWDVMKW